MAQTNATTMQPKLAVLHAAILSFGSPSFPVMSHRARRKRKRLGVIVDAPVLSFLMARRNHLAAFIAAARASFNFAIIAVEPPRSG
jgi:hypothetical protein